MSVYWQYSLIYFNVIMGVTSDYPYHILFVKRVTDSTCILWEEIMEGHKYQQIELIGGSPECLFATELSCQLFS